MNWLFLRGLGREQRHWGSFAEVFEDKLQGHKVLCLDLPGTGEEGHRSSPEKISLITDDIRSRWMPLAQSTDGEWGILGISLGGMITLDWCSRFHDFKNAVVINSSARGTGSLTSRLQGSAFKSFFKIALTSDSTEKEKLILEITSEKPESESSHIIANWVSIAESSPVSLRNLSAQLFAAAQFETPSSVLGTNLLLLSALNDQIASPQCSEVIAKKLNAPLKVHATAGHDLPLDDPEWVCEKIAEHIHPKKN